MKSKYIQWSYTPRTTVDADEIQALLEEFRSQGGVEAQSKTVQKEWLSHPIVYKVDTSGSWTTLYYSVADEDGIHSIGRYVCHRYKAKEEFEQRKELDVKPAECRQEIQDRFERFEHITMRRAFGVCNSAFFRDVVPKPIYYMDRSMNGYDVRGVQYIDVSAMYPANGRGLLPDFNRCKIVSGRVEPNEEFRFAFYLCSHHCAEYGVFDTHDYMKLPLEFMKWQCFTDDGKPIYKNVRDDEEMTVLMPASRYEMTQTFESIWNDRFSDDEYTKAKAKAVANIGIGTLHRNPSNFGRTDMNDFYHIAAIILGRSNQVQYNMIEHIRKNGGVILQAIVDSLIYIGDENYGSDTKVFGGYYNEFHQTVHYRCVDAINRYVIYDDNEKILKCVVGGVKNGKDKVKKPTDIDQFRRV